jgi:hypothetical protein
MPDEGLSVEGPQFAQKVREAEEIVHKLEANRWDFNAAPDAFAKRGGADVVAKEIAVIFDGVTLTRVGRLVMGGVGRLFNLMGPIHPMSTFKTTDSRLLDAINRQIGSNGLLDFPEFSKWGTPQEVEFFNLTNFYQLRDLVFWSVLHGSGCSPSTLEHMVRHFASGMVVQNVMYAPSVPSSDPEKPALMAATCLSLSFPTTVVEWMDKPLFGGLVSETIHIEHLLTPEPTSVSHPYLPLAEEGVVEYQHRRYFLRRFAGVTPKNGVRGPDVPLEGQTSFGEPSGWVTAA